MDEHEYESLKEDLEVATFASTLAQNFPDSYSIENVFEIADTLDMASKKIDNVMKKDSNCSQKYIKNDYLLY